MPSKRPPPLEDPPSASDSDSDSSTEGEEEEVEDSPEDETQLQQTQQQVVRTPLKFSLKKPNSNSNSVPNPPSDSSSEEEPDGSESPDSGSDSDSPAPTHAPSSAALAIKPISSKPMVLTPKSETPSGASSGSVKRRLEAEEKGSGKDQKKKKVSDIGAKEEKKLFQRLWTEQDEIVILKGMINFRKRGKDPSSQAVEFFDSIKDQLRPDVNKVQVNGKIRTIRRKYLTALNKVKSPGADPEFSKPHDAKVYQLSKKVWSLEGNINDDDEPTPVVVVAPAEAVEEDGEKDGEKSKSKSKRVSEGVAASPSKPKATTLPEKSPMVIEKEDSENISEYTFLNASLLPRDLPLPAPGLGEFFQKRGWNLIGKSNAVGFDKRWKNVMIAETKAYLQRIDLVREQTQAMLDALESSDL